MTCDKWNRTTLSFIERLVLIGHCTWANTCRDTPRGVAHCLSMYISARLSYPIFLFPFFSTFPGIDTLAALIQVSPSVAEEPAYQRGVIDCLNDPDETLKRKVTQQQQLCARRSGLRLRHIMLPWCSIVLRVSFRNWERFVRNWQWKMCMWWTWSEGRMFN